MVSAILKDKAPVLHSVQSFGCLNEMYMKIFCNLYKLRRLVYQLNLEFTAQLPQAVSTQIRYITSESLLFLEKAERSTGNYEVRSIKYKLF